MAWWNRPKKKVTSPSGLAEQDNTGEWFTYFMQYLSTLDNNNVLRLDDENAYEIACNLAEVFIPIDAIADRAASVGYRLRDKKTLEVYEPKGNLARLVESPNPFDKIQDLVYKSVFSEYADGNSYIYTKTPESIVNPTIDNISNVWVLQPNVTKPVFFKSVPNPFLVKDKQELIEYYRTFFMYKHSIKPRYILHTTLTGIGADGKATSPLFKVRRNIDNVMQVYQARYNVYKKNGNGGILSRDAAALKSSIEETVDPVTRDAILSDLQNRNGITGDKNFIGISSIPLRFVKTLGTIAELQPFDETEANAVTIAGTFGVNKELIPKKDSSTFANQKDAEKALWQNVVKGVCENKAKDLTKAFYLPDNLEFFADLSTVEALQEDKKTALESDSILIANLASLSQSGQDVKAALQSLSDKYNGK